MANTTDSIKDFVGEALEEEYGEEIEVTVHVKIENEETKNDQMLSLLFIIIGILLLICILFSIIALWRFYQKKRSNWEITSAVSSMSDIGKDRHVMIQRKDGNDDHDELNKVHKNQTQKQNEESLSEDMYNSKKEETIHSNIITSDTS